MSISFNTSSQNLPMIQFTDTKKQRYEDNYYAPMDKRTQTIRNKLERRLSEIEEKMTQERLNRAKEKIHNWIARHNADRVAIQKESLHLFTGGKDAAPISRGIANIRKRLEEGLYSTPTTLADLKGRVKKSV